MTSKSETKAIARSLGMSVACYNNIVVGDTPPRRQTGQERRKSRPFGGRRKHDVTRSAIEIVRLAYHGADLEKLIINALEGLE